METVNNIKPMYISRSIGGALYLVGAILMVYNLAKTMAKGSFVANEAAAAPLAKASGEHKEYWHRIIERRPVTMLVLSLQDGCHRWFG